MPMGETEPMAVDEVDGDEIHDEDPVYGPQTLDESNLDDIHRMRRDALNGLYGRLEQAHQDGAFDLRLTGGPIGFEQYKYSCIYTSLTFAGVHLHPKGYVSCPFCDTWFLH